jgi:hypothetical protein
MSNFKTFLKKRFTKKDVLVDMAVEVDNILESELALTTRFSYQY